MVRFGIVGTNFIVDQWIAGGRLHPEFALGAVYSRSLEKGQAFAEKHGIPQVFTSLEEMADSGTIDAVYIATPNALHCPQTLLFLAKKIPVFCEKPLACNKKEAKQMIDLSRSQKTLLFLGLKNTLEPRLKAVKDNLYRLGKLRRVTAAYCKYSSRYDQYKQGVIENAWKPSLGGGAAMDLGIYVIQPLVHLFGKPKALACSGILMDTGVDSQGVILASYPEMDAILSFGKTFATLSRTEFQGEDGNMILDKTTETPIVITYKDGTREEINYDQDKDAMFYEIEEFISLLAAGKIESAINRHEDALNAMEIIDTYRKQVGVVYPADEA